MPHSKLEFNPNDTGTPPQTEINRDFWELAFGFNDRIGEAVYDPVTGEFLHWNSIYHRKHPDFASVADILRRWVFPDDLSYLGTEDGEGGVNLEGSPYARAVTGGEEGIPDPWSDWKLWSPNYEVEGAPVSRWMDGPLGGSIEDALNWAPRPRPFGDTIGRLNLSTTDRKPIVWLHFNAPDPKTALALTGWVRYSGTPEIDKKRAAIWFAEENLMDSTALRENPLVGEKNMIESYINGRFCVAITATVVGDNRLRRNCSPSGSTLTRQRTAIVDLGYERFRFRNRIERDGFRLYEPDPEPEFNSTYDVVEDFNRFADAAAQQLASDATAGSWTAPYIKTDVRLGDSFSGCEGMGINFQSFPEVVAIEYVKDPKAGYQTIYHLTDLRHAPDVGSE